jgi:hypothetical protein
MIEGGRKKDTTAVEEETNTVDVVNGSVKLKDL